MSFKNILKGEYTEAENVMLEKHVPTIEILSGHGGDGNNLVRVIVGKEVAHPNTIEHHIAWIELYGVKQTGESVNLGRIVLSPGNTVPDVSFKVEHIEDFKSFCALEYCNVHGVWEGSLDITDL